MRRCPAAQTIMSQSPQSSISTEIASAASEEAAPASIVAAPPIRSHVLLIREASELVLKLPVSSIRAGQ